MKVLIFANKEKDKDGKILSDLQFHLKNNNVDFFELEEHAKEIDQGFSALFIIGGDGTILHKIDLATKYNLPIIGINAGKLGFLTEFEPFEVQQAVELFISGKLIQDIRTTALICLNNEYLALNDLVIQRISNDSLDKTLTLDVYIDNDKIDSIIGDGVIISTPTGSTAYSLSAGGAILAPGINAFSITPLAAHSYSQRTVVYSANNNCKIKLIRGSKIGAFVDGILVDCLKCNDSIIVKQSQKVINFLRKENSSFFKRLSLKIKNRT